MRSSATAEDLPFASFAGQQDTYLHVIGQEAVLGRRPALLGLALDGPRGRVPRDATASTTRSVRLAVVVQRMVEAEVAGVLFTANPVTGRRRQAVIDASPGLGEAVVSGAVNPDHFVVDTDRRRDPRAAARRQAVRGATAAGRRHGARGDEGPRGSRRASPTIRCWRWPRSATGSRRTTAAPQDTEWAIDGVGRLWLTQARPITTLFPIPQRPHAPRTPDGLRVYFCFSVAQGLTRPITPMGLAAFRLLSAVAARLTGFRVDDPSAGSHVYAEGGQRVFVDLTGVLRGRRRPRAGAARPRRDGGALGGHPSRPVRRPATVGDAAVSASASSSGPCASSSATACPCGCVEALVRPEAARARATRIGGRLASRLQLAKSASAAERLDFAERVLGREIILLGPRLLPVAAAGLGLLGVAGKLLGDDARARRSADRAARPAPQRDDRDGPRAVGAGRV